MFIHTAYDNGPVTVGYKATGADAVQFHRLLKYEKEHKSRHLADEVENSPSSDLLRRGVSLHGSLTCHIFMWYMDSMQYN